MKAWANPLYDNSRWCGIIKCGDFYFRRGLTWPRRTAYGVSIGDYPPGSILGDQGPVIFSPTDKLLPLLGIVNSAAFRGFVSLHMAFGSYEVGVIQRTPLPDVCAGIV